MSDKRVARGRVFRVDNMERKFGESITYNFIFVEDTRSDTEKAVESIGGNTEILPSEYPLLFTDHEIAVARNRALRNKEDLLEKDFLTDFTDDLF
jgi:hypothetical protein